MSFTQLTKFFPRSVQLLFAVVSTIGAAYLGGVMSAATAQEKMRTTAQEVLAPHVTSDNESHAQTAADLLDIKLWQAHHSRHDAAVNAALNRIDVSLCVLVQRAHQQCQPMIPLDVVEE